VRVIGIGLLSLPAVIGMGVYKTDRRVVEPLLVFVLVLLKGFLIRFRIPFHEKFLLTWFLLL
jgi:hypothetical protein